MTVAAPVAVVPAPAQATAPAPTTPASAAPNQLAQDVDELSNQTVGTGNYRTLFVMHKSDPVVTGTSYAAQGFDLLSDAVAAAGQHCKDTAASDGFGEGSVVIKVDGKYVPFSTQWQMLTWNDESGAGYIDSFTPRQLSVSDAVVKAAIDGSAHIVAFS
jgi:hypothetical protein